jgi:hypothetical protein
MKSIEELLETFEANLEALDSTRKKLFEAQDPVSRSTSIIYCELERLQMQQITAIRALYLEMTNTKVDLLRTMVGPVGDKVDE